MSPRHLLVTGPTRSGTTLVARLLDAHPEVTIASQPFPSVYIEAGADFLAARGLPRPALPLGDLFLEERYRPEEIDRFLAAYAPGEDRLTEVWTVMERYSGRQTVVPLPANAHGASCFADLLARLHDAAAVRGVAVAGSKEVMVEEFLPYLTGHGFRGLLVIRDPRDVVASTLAPGGGRWVGRPRPLLFILRNWRRAAMMAAALDGAPGFAVTRFEDLVGDTAGTLARLAGFLEVTPFPADAAAALGDWQGNSSFGEVAGISPDAVGRHRVALDDTAIRYVETLCGPEMDWLGYDRPDHRDVAALAGFTEAGPVRDDVDPGMSTAPERLAEETERLRLAASGDATPDEQRRYFRFPAAYERVSAAYREGAP